jgi:hypothetical protein
VSNSTIAVTFVAAAVSIGVFAATPAAADADGPSRGDAQAVLEAGLTGGVAIRTHSGNDQGAPGGQSVSVTGPRITPLRSAEYCVEGWHVISIGQISALDRPREEVYEELSGLTVRYLFDGGELDTVRTPIKAFPGGLFGLPAVQFNVGAFLPPGSLTAGSHTLITIFGEVGLPDEQVEVEITGLDCG